jgi:hypothetical protein
LPESAAASALKIAERARLRRPMPHSTTGPPLEALRAFDGFLRQLCGSGRYDLPFGSPATITCVAKSRTGQMSLIFGGNEYERVSTAVAMLVMRFGERGCTCADMACTRMFLKIGRRVCSDACGNRTRVSRVRARDPEHARELQHRAYVRRKRRELGKAKVKIPPRPRRGI